MNRRAMLAARKVLEAKMECTLKQHKLVSKVVDLPLFWEKDDRFVSGERVVHLRRHPSTGFSWKSGYALGLRTYDYRRCAVLFDNGSVARSIGVDNVFLAVKESDSTIYLGRKSGMFRKDVYATLCKKCGSIDKIYQTHRCCS